LEDADSEIVVGADHWNVHRHPRTILEVRRILLEHSAQMLAESGLGSATPLEGVCDRPDAGRRLDGGAAR
jgi:hypothetical protein